MLGPQILRNRPDVLNRRQDGQPSQTTPGPSRIVINDGNRIPLTTAMNFPQQGIGRLARPDDEDRLTTQLSRTIKAVLLPTTIGKTCSTHNDREKKRVQDQHRARNQRHLENGNYRRGQQCTNEDRTQQML